MRNAHLLVLAAVGAGLVLGLAAWATFQARAHQNQAYDFRLTDQNGQPFRLSDERGHAVAIYFGYTRCTDTCLTTMAHLASARRAMGPAGARTRVIFVTIDPAHDTPGVLKEYLTHFDPSFIGLTGRQGELAPVYRAYHVAFEATPNPSRAPNRSRCIRPWCGLSMPGGIPPPLRIRTIRRARSQTI